MSSPEDLRTSQVAAENPSEPETRAARPQSRAARTGRKAGALLFAGLAASGCTISIETSSPASSTSATSEAPTPPATTTANRAPTTSQAPVVTGKTYTEVSQYGANVFSDYKSGNGITVRVAVGQSVSAICIEYDPAAAIPSTAGLWYRVAPDSRITAGGFVPANTFWNQEPPQPPDQNHQYDAQVPVCADSPGHQLPPVAGGH